MAFTFDHDTFVITIPQSDLTFVQGTFYRLDTELFREQLISFEDSEEGMYLPNTHNHNTTVTVAGITYARAIEVRFPYSITFEDGVYTVELVGSNNNFFDVEKGILNQNGVSVIPTNAAGLIIFESPVSGLTVDEATYLRELYKLRGLEQGEDLVVTPDDRKVGDGSVISQTIVKVGDEVTVSRDP